MHDFNRSPFDPDELLLGPEDQVLPVWHVYCWLATALFLAACLVVCVL